MKVLIDTPVWSIVLRKSDKSLKPEEIQIKEHLIELIEDGRVAIIGPIRQEILSGLTNQDMYEILRERLAPFEDIPIQTNDYERAAKFSNTCRKKGVQGSHIDFLICAISFNHNLPIFTLDKDFLNYSKYIEVEVYKLPR